MTAIGKKTVLHEGHSVNPKRQASPHTHFVTVTPDDRYLCVVDLGLDKVFRYDLSLQYLDSFSLPAGSGPRHLVFSDDGAYCFVVSELASTVTSFAYADGRFERIDTVSCLPKGYAGESTAAAIRCFDGKIYASNRGHDSVAVIGQEQGKLTLSGIYSTCGSSPRDFVVSEEYILVANEQSHTVNLFDRQMHPLTAVTGIPSPVCVLML